MWEFEIQAVRPNFLIKKEHIAHKCIYNLVFIAVTYCNCCFYPSHHGLCVCVSQEGIVEKLFKWAQEAEQPLRIYATGLLAGAMENQDIAANYREENSVLVSGGHRLCLSAGFYSHANITRVLHKVALEFSAMS